MANKKLLITALLIFTIFSLVGITFASPMTQDVPKNKIIVFKPGVSEERQEELIKRFNINKTKDLRLINGKAVLLSERLENKLKRLPEILRIDNDVEVFTLARFYQLKKYKSQPSQVLPWGIDRIDAERVWATTSADNVTVGVIDTGIDLKHPDLQANIKGGYNAINPRKLPQDDNGHGTHVAGIIAALNNDIGVVGVGPKIDLYAIKVLGANGSGYLSDVIEGLDWAIQKNIQVVNMSLGTSENVLSFQEAIQRAYNAGITIVAAAGNTGGSVLYPAAYPEVIAVSAIDQYDQIASWSSRGQEIDFAAPGVSIYSTYKGSSYATLSGTSMAAPHLAGVAALVLSQLDKCDINNNGECDPGEVKEKLKNSTEDLGSPGWDDLFGFGLVNAEKVVNW